MTGYDPLGRACRHRREEGRGQSLGQYGDRVLRAGKGAEKWQHGRVGVNQGSETNRGCRKETGSRVLNAVKRSD